MELDDFITFGEVDREWQGQINLDKPSALDKIIQPNIDKSEPVI